VQKYSLLANENHFSNPSGGLSLYLKNGARRTIRDSKKKKRLGKGKKRREKKNKILGLPALILKHGLRISFALTLLKCCPRFVRVLDYFSKRVRIVGGERG
jgi:hypothetical protein